MYAEEPVIRAQETTIGGDIFLDSCLEFFLLPNANKSRQALLNDQELLLPDRREAVYADGKCPLPHQ